MRRRTRFHALSLLRLPAAWQARFTYVFFFVLDLFHNGRSHVRAHTQRQTWTHVRALLSATGVFSSPLPPLPVDP